MKQTNFSISDFYEPKKIAAIALFLVAFFAFVGEIISGFHAQGEVKSFVIQERITNESAQLRPDSTVFTMNLFGEYTPNLSEAEIKQSMLDIQVVGIMFSSRESDSQVIIRTSTGEEKYYVVGDTLPGGAIIKRISEKGIVVLHNGALESLSLPKNELIFDAPAKPLIGE